MATAQSSIKIKSIEFGRPPFRKLGELKIDFADRLTVIAGHNGIGKSTILGLLTNTFGLTDESGPKSYFGDSFYHNIEKIVYLALEEVDVAQQAPASLPVVISNVGGIDVRKRCALTRRARYKRARVVPRTVERTDDDPVGPDAKVPLPAIYLGMRRLASIGEADEREVMSTTPEMHDEDRGLMAEFVRAVILGTQVNDGVTHHSIKGSKKKTIQPGYDLHDAQAVSVGQDSLASIATALASFNQLQRELGGAYPGGLLVIDELDVGFHPHAIGKLAIALKKYAKRLRLQVVATTHSPSLIQAVHPDGDGNAHAPDKVVYLLDTRSPRLAEDQSLAAILGDMTLKVDRSIPPKVKKPALCVYFEDAEGVQFLDGLLPVKSRAQIGRNNGVVIKLVPLGVGGSNLIGLPDKDPIFRDRVLVVDADTTISQKAARRGNTIKLPCKRGSRGVARSPENTIIDFLRGLTVGAADLNRQIMLKFKVRNVSSDLILETFFAGGGGANQQRDATKSWWIDHWEQLKKWGVVGVWADVHSEEVGAFIESFETAVARTAPRLL